MFVSGLAGTLMEISENPETRYQFLIWFDYTRRAINEIQEGVLVAVPNFASDGATRRYSVLEVVGILPMHYALHGGTSGYPGFVMEAARSAAEDWEEQETSPTEDATKIRLLAIPTNLEIAEPTSGDPSIGPESNIPMVGAEVRLLDTNYSNLMANYGIDLERECNLTVIGTLARNEAVDVYVRIEDLVRTHFAVFGFTGVGKSNLVSTLTAKILQDSEDPVKVVLFDPMSEYTILLLDQLLDRDITARILTIGRHTLPESVFRHLGTSRDDHLAEAVQQYARYSLLPKALLPERRDIDRALRDLLARRLIAFYHAEQSLTVYDLFFTEETPWGARRGKEKAQKRRQVAKNALRAVLRGQDYKKTTFTPDLARSIREALETELEKDATFTDDFEPILRRLTELERVTAETHAAGITLQELVDDLNDPSRSSLWVVQAHNLDELRRFAKQLGEALYESRRQLGLIDPLVAIIFDEADEFVRREATGSYSDSAEIAETLARRGRKFGLGLGIATQRIRYLDTTIMSQPHTYLVSKLPRFSDRQAVAEAFGIAEGLLNQTFKFIKGQWLLMSHGAAGLEAVPLPVRTPDANQRIADWLATRFNTEVEPAADGTVADLA